MNRAQRRAAPKASDHQSWVTGVREVHAAAGGALDLYYVTPADLPRLIFGATVGDLEATALTRATLDTVRHINDAPTSKAALCGCCDNEIKGTAFIVIVASPMGKPLAGSRAVCSALCVTCQTDVRQNALRSIRRIWPEARHVTVTHGERGVVH